VRCDTAWIGTFQFPYLETCSARKWRKVRGEGGGHVMQTVAALWQEISVYSVSPKYIFELAVFAESYTQARRIPTPPSPHSLNTFQVVKIWELECI
jgi:hypothetical protein